MTKIKDYTLDDYSPMNVQRANPYRQKVKFCCLGLGWNRELLQMDVRHHFGMREML